MGCKLAELIIAIDSAYGLTEDATDVAELEDKHGAKLRLWVTETATFSLTVYLIEQRQRMLLWVWR